MIRSRFFNKNVVNFNFYKNNNQSRTRTMASSTGSTSTSTSSSKKGAKLNRLQHEKSPYLLQHQSNPVDW